MQEMCRLLYVLALAFPLNNVGVRAKIAYPKIVKVQRLSRSVYVQIKISARHGHLSDEIQNHIREKANKLLHYFQRIMMIEVTVDVKDEEKLVEFLVSAEHKHD